jgi:hypothetical protein
MVTGFRGGSWNGYSNNFTIRNADAHAWAEIFDVTAGGWWRTDPLAPSTTAQTDEVRGEAAMASRLDRSWKARIDSLRVFWYRRIVSFDQRSQAETLKAVKEATENSSRRLREALTTALDEAKAWLTSPWDTRRFGQLVSGLAVFAVFIWLWRQFAGRFWRGLMGGAAAQREDPVRREAGKWLHHAAAFRGGPEDFERVVRDLQRLRYGARATWPEPDKVFRQARRTLREARRALPLTRS